MSEIQLFAIKDKVEELIPMLTSNERELQTLIETNMETFFNVRLVESEYVITGGRMDSIGLDENNCPVIFEYKLRNNENVINQGLYYLDWLEEHHGDFQMVVYDKFGKDHDIDWSDTTLICVANDFNKYDSHAVRQMGRNIKLVKYKKYNELILFEFLNNDNEISKNKSTNSLREMSTSIDLKNDNKSEKYVHDTLEYRIKNSNVKDLYNQVCERIEEMCPDLEVRDLKHYRSYKKAVKTIICVEVYKEHVLLHLKLNPKDYTIPDEFKMLRDMSNIGHWGVGDLEVKIKSERDLDAALSYIKDANDKN